MACEVPVISSDAGGLPELNMQGVTGFLCPVGDVECMTQKALLVLDPSNLPRFKENALKRAREFDISQILPRYETLYHQVIEQAKALAAP
jgi:glycosyltransferase involved in cell wall biosynthesis